MTPGWRGRAIQHTLAGLAGSSQLRPLLQLRFNFIKVSQVVSFMQAVLSILRIGPGNRRPLAAASPTPKPNHLAQFLTGTRSDRIMNETDSFENDAATAGGPTASEAQNPPQASRLPKIIRFDDLARCGEEIWIENNGQIYRLRRTRQGKLILTK